eukprot:TRINITY_DN26092_c0_g1_i1.p1 TRINITY_DN26092_c0_g1~~TRINITY_DN26092_c0_g1_i1.p1  ORF type:complete len:432 (+),score=8.74 TRINITY_DN26092_c0_g1_i1:24-1298(+)
MAPRARLAVYKALWYKNGEGYGHDCDIWAAVDKAVADGVDVISMSMGSGEDTYFNDMPLLRAVQAGVFVSMAAGNEGPPSPITTAWRTLSNASPYYLTVAASSTDQDSTFFSMQSTQSTAVDATGTHSQFTTNKSDNASVSLQPITRPSQTIVDPAMATFSSAGPPIRPNRNTAALNTGITNHILKPDITGPGQDRVAAAPGGWKGQGYYSSKSGTSMSTPQLAGIAALVIQKYPKWSPAAVKSAIMTTATVLNRKGGKIQMGWGGLATPWNFGSGHVNPPKMLNPGLVYDVAVYGFANVLAKLDPAAAQSEFPNQKFNPIHAYNLNQPNIAIGRLSSVVTVTRNVKSVADRARMYNLKLTKPSGVEVSVQPTSFTIQPGQTLSYKVTFTPKSASGSFSFGSLSWTDGVHWVRSSIAVQPMKAL